MQGLVVGASIPSSPPGDLMCILYLEKTAIGGLGAGGMGGYRGAVCPWEMAHHGGRDLRLIVRLGVD